MPVQNNFDSVFKVRSLVQALAVLTLCFFLLFSAHSYFLYQQYIDSRIELAGNIATSASAEIESYIKQSEQRLDRLIEKNHHLLIELTNKETPETRAQVTILLKDYFPESVKFGIVDEDGSIIVDFDEYPIGNVCLKDIQQYFNDEGSYKAYVHSTPYNYHFDLFTKTELHGKNNIFVVSNSLDGIARILEHHRTQGLKLALFNSKFDNLLEVGQQGARGQNGLPLRWALSEGSDIYAVQYINRSSWELRVITDGEKEAQFIIKHLKEQVLFFCIFLFLIYIVFMYILRLNRIRTNLLEKLSDDAEAFRSQNINLPLPYFVFDKNLKIVTANKAWCALFGTTEELATGVQLEYYFPIVAMQKLKKKLPAYISTHGIDHEIFSVLDSAGFMINVSITGSFEFDYSGKFIRCNCTLANLTDEEKTNDYLRSLEQRHSLHWMQSYAGLIELNAELRVIDWNLAAERIFGFTKDEVLGLHAKDIILPKKLVAQVDNAWSKLLSKKGGEHEIIVNLTKDNREIICEWFNTSLTSETGKVIGISSFVMDITDKKEKEKIHEDHKLELQQVIDSMVNGVITINECDIILSFNQSAEKMFGYNKNYIIGCNLNILMPENIQHDSYLSNSALTGKSNFIGINRELSGKRKNGEWFPVQLSVSELPQRDAGSRVFVATCIDLTQQREMEDALRHTRKMEVVGVMAGGIAHDFNNLLGVISGNLEILKRFSNDNVDMTRWIDSGLKMTARGANLTRRLLGFSRVRPRESRTVSIGDLLIEIKPVLEKSLGHRVKLTYDISENLWLVDIDTDDFEDSVVNLLINAKDAMNNSGVLHVHAYNIDLSQIEKDETITVHAGEHVVCCVADSGAGIDPVVQKKMFDPFYTTKEKGKGTGLGLSMVQSFIKRSNGSIRVISELGTGTTFCMYLPKSKMDKTKAQIAERCSVPRGKETILVVDDEELLVEVTAENLHDLGYKVLTATSAEQALVVLKQTDKISLIFSDIIMPGGMDGYALCEIALKRQPGLKVLLASGYIPEKRISESNYQSEKLKAFSSSYLNKPYDRLSLAKRVRMILDQDIENG